MKTRILLIALCLTTGMCFADQSSPDPISIKRAIQIDALSKDIERLAQQIRATEDDMIEFIRIHDIHRVNIRAAAEQAHLEKIVKERLDAELSLLMLEAKHPFLADTNIVANISNEDILRDERNTLLRTIEALKTAEETWRPRNLLAIQRETQLRQFKKNLSLLENIHAQLTEELFDLKMEEGLNSKKQNNLLNPTEGS